MTPREKILRITEMMGMKATIAAKAMGITTATYRQKMSDRSPRHWFNEKNVTDLSAYISEKAKEIAIL